MHEMTTTGENIESTEMEQFGSPFTRLLRFADMPNLCGEIEKNELTQIGRDVVELTELDESSRADWMKKSEYAMEAALQAVKEKTEPWPGASNIKHPGITVAALQFHARTYPVIVQSDNVVKAKVTGRDNEGLKAEQAKRISQHMNYQLLDENEDWDEDMDKMLLALPIEGVAFKKTYYNPETGKNVSEWVRPKDFIVDNGTKSLAECPRMTHRLEYHPYQIDNFFRSGTWHEAELHIDTEDKDREVKQTFFEQHVYLDLDGDDYKEPYIVTVHKESQAVVRVRAGFYKENIKVTYAGKTQPLQVLMAFFTEMGAKSIDDIPVEVMEEIEVAGVERAQMFTKFGFIPSPDGSFYDIGIGQLAGPLNDAVDSILNQLIDAGTLANSAGGFVRDGVSVDGQRGPIQWIMGKFQRIKAPASQNLSDAIYQMKFPEPSLVLFNLLGFVSQMEKDVTGVQDVLLGGDVPANQSPTTHIAQIEQGMKVFSAIYKRIYRSLKQEFRKIYKLNGRYLRPEQYFMVLDTQEVEKIGLADYQNDGTDVQPVADPKAATTILAMAKAQALLVLKGDPGVSADEVNKFYIETLDVPAPDSFIVPPEERQQGPDPKLLLEVMSAADKHVKTQAEIVKLYAEAIQKLADAEAKEAGAQIDIYTAQVQGLRQIIDGFNQGREGSMAGPAGNQGGIPGVVAGATGVPGGSQRQPGHGAGPVLPGAN